MFSIARLRLSSIAAGILMAASIAPAQTPAPTKVAVVSLQRAVLESAEIKKASAELEAKFRPRQQQMEQLQKEIQGLEQQLREGQGKLTPAAEADLTAQGQRKQRDLQRQTEDLQQDVERERNEILSKSSRQMSEVVKKIAEAKGYDVVIDVTNTVFFKPALEITNDAIAEYNKVYPAK